MKMKLTIVAMLPAAVTSLSAHVMVSPPQSTAGAVQKYELRVHNEGKVAASSIDLEVPDGVTVTEVTKAPASTFTTKTSWSDKPGSKQKGSTTTLATASSTTGTTADHTWAGTISDKMCGADHKKMGTKMSLSECTLACAKGGAPYVLVADGKVYQLTNHDAELRTHAGHEVTVTGDLNGDTIKVSKIEMKAQGRTN